MYAAGFAGPACEMLWGPEVLAVEAVLDRLAQAPGPGEGVGGWTFAGEGATKHAEAIASAGGTLAPPPLGVPRASALLWLAHVAGEGGRIADPGSWEPEYVRASGAERGVGRHV